MFSETVMSILEASGWSPHRKVSVTHTVNQLESEGFTMLPDAVKLLEEFGGLKISPRQTALDTFLNGVIHFDPILAASGEFDRINYWQTRLNIKLSPLAEGSKGEVLLLAEDGRICSCYEGQLFLDGTSFEDALESTLIVAKRKSIEIGRVAE